MQKRTREILALVLLLLLGLGGICAMAWYLFAAHSWNITATNIDDSIGQMKGYTVFLVEGNKPIPPEELVEPSPNDVTAKTTEGGGEEKPTSASDGQMPSSEDQSNEGVLVDTSGNVVDSNTVETAEGEIIRTMTELIMEYQDKGADVFVIESAEEGAYNKPVIFNAASRTVGVFKVNNPARPAAVKTGAKLLNRVNTDFNILVTSDSGLEGAPLNDVDLIVFNPEEGLYSSGRYGANAYCVDTPLEGQVQAIIVAPSGVISSKVIDL